jgi:hypothetical protein
MTDGMEASSEAEKKQGLPAWAAQVFRECLDKHDRLFQVLHLSMAGISMVRGRANALKVLAEVDGKVADAEAKLKRAEAEKELAQREVDHGFPILHEQATIALWGSLEALVRTLLAKWLEHKPEAWKCESINRIKVKIGDYETLERQEKCLWIVDLIDQEADGPLRAGIERFERLLKAFGLDGPVVEDSRRALYELSQVRNVLVHRSGIVDRKLSGACPWLNLPVGQPLIVSHKMWRQYQDAFGQYVLELIQRVRVHFGVGRYLPDNANQNPPKGRKTSEEDVAL